MQPSHSLPSTCYLHHYLCTVTGMNRRITEESPLPSLTVDLNGLYFDVSYQSAILRHASNLSLISDLSISSLQEVAIFGRSTKCSYVPSSHPYCKAIEVLGTMHLSAVQISSLGGTSLKCSSNNPTFNLIMTLLRSSGLVMAIRTKPEICESGCRQLQAVGIIQSVSPDFAVLTWLRLV